MTTVLVLAYFLRGKSKLSFRRKFIRFDGPMIRSITAIVLSSFCVQVASALTSSMLNLQITNLGATDVIGADGVHVGQDDVDVTLARAYDAVGFLPRRS